jgi:hypothetical protein
MLIMLQILLYVFRIPESLCSQPMMLDAISIVVLAGVWSHMVPFYKL